MRYSPTLGRGKSALILSLSSAISPVYVSLSPAPVLVNTDSDFRPVSIVDLFPEAYRALPDMDARTKDNQRVKARVFPFFIAVVCIS